MGLIAQRMADAAGEIRGASDFLSNDDWEPGGGTMTTSGVRVTRQVALGLTTIWRCTDLLSSAVAMAPIDVTVKVGGKSFPEFVKPAWLRQPDPFNPNYDISDYFAEVALSLLIEGNFFTRVFPYVFDPQALIVVDPRLVEVKPGPVYVIKDEKGREVESCGPMEMLHGWWIRVGGELRGISPLESLRRGIGSAVAAEDFAGRFFGQGASLAFGVEVPGPMDPTKLGDLRSSLRAKYVGLRNSHAIGVLSDGGKFVTGLAPTPEQAQMLDTRKWGVEDLCRPYGVPPSMAGSQEPGAASYASAAVWDMQFKQRAVQPLATRIERRHERLLAVPDGVADPNAEAQLRFNLDAIARADLLTRAQASGEFVTKGQMTPNEARALEDRPPLPGGDDLYMQQQMVPLGRPVVVETARSVAEEEERVPVVVNNHFGEQRSVEPSQTTIVLPDSITIPPQPAPIVNIAAPPAAVNNIDLEPVAEAVRALQEQIIALGSQPAPVVNVPEQPPAIVNVTMPDHFAITSMPDRMTSRKVKRSAAGQITETVELETDA